jgi:hypothetical protein
MIDEKGRVQWTRPFSFRALLSWLPQVNQLLEAARDFDAIPYLA